MDRQTTRAIKAIARMVGIIRQSDREPGLTLMLCTQDNDDINCEIDTVIITQL